MSGLKKWEQDMARRQAGELVEYLNHPQQLNANGQQELAKIESMLRSLRALRRQEAEGNVLILSSDPDLETVNQVLGRYQWITQLNVGDGQYLYFVEDPADLAQKDILET